MKKTKLILPLLAIVFAFSACSTIEDAVFSARYMKNDANKVDQLARSNEAGMTEANVIEDVPTLTASVSDVLYLVPVSFTPMTNASSNTAKTEQVVSNSSSASSSFAKNNKKFEAKQALIAKKLEKQAKKPAGGKSQLVALILVIFVGAIGIHRFYLGYTAIGIIQLLTGGGCGIWALIDLIRIATGDLQPKNGSYSETL